jgi:hypothetical protein
MSHGIQLYSSSGALRIQLTDYLAVLVGSASISLPGYGSITLTIPSHARDFSLVIADGGLFDTTSEVKNGYEKPVAWRDFAGITNDSSITIRNGSSVATKLRVGFIGV